MVLSFRFFSWWSEKWIEVTWKVFHLARELVVGFQLGESIIADWPQNDMNENQKCNWQWGELDQSWWLDVRIDRGGLATDQNDIGNWQDIKTIGHCSGGSNQLRESIMANWRPVIPYHQKKCKSLTVKLSTWGLTHVAFSGRADAFCFNLTSWKWIYIWTKNNQNQDKYNKRDGLLKEEQEENWCCVCWRDEVQKCDKVKHFSKTLQIYDKVKKVLKLCKNVAKLKISLKMWQD